MNINLNKFPNKSQTNQIMINKQNNNADNLQSEDRWWCFCKGKEDYNEQEFIPTTETIAKQFKKYRKKNGINETKLSLKRNRKSITNNKSNNFTSNNNLQSQILKSMPPISSIPESTSINLTSHNMYQSKTYPKNHHFSINSANNNFNQSATRISYPNYNINAFNYHVTNKYQRQRQMQEIKQRSKYNKSNKFQEQEVISLKPSNGAPISNTAEQVRISQQLNNSIKISQISQSNNFYEVPELVQKISSCDKFKQKKLKVVKTISILSEGSQQCSQIIYGYRDTQLKLIKQEQQKSK